MEKYVRRQAKIRFVLKVSNSNDFSEKKSFRNCLVWFGLGRLNERSNFKKAEISKIPSFGVRHWY